MFDTILNSIIPSRPVVYESSEYYLCESYCLGKSWLWNLFFGWWKSKDCGANGTMCCYRIPQKAWKEIEKLAEEMKD